MSLRAILWVMEDAPVDSQGELAVLYALADRAGDDGTAAFPGQDWIAHRARCSTRTVRNHLKSLEDRGLISRGDSALVDHIPVNRRPVVWDLNLGAVRAENDRPENISGRKIGTPWPENSGDLAGKSESFGRKGVSYKPSLTPHEPPNKPSDTRACALSPDWALSDEEVESFAEKYPGVDIRLEESKFRDYWLDRGTKRKSWRLTFHNWCARAKPSEVPEWRKLDSWSLDEGEVAPF